MGRATRILQPRGDQHGCGLLAGNSSSVSTHAKLATCIGKTTPVAGQGTPRGENLRISIDFTSFPVRNCKFPLISTDFSSSRRAVGGNFHLWYVWECSVRLQEKNPRYGWAAPAPNGIRISSQNPPISVDSNGFLVRIYQIFTNPTGPAGPVSTHQSDPCRIKVFTHG